MEELLLDVFGERGEEIMDLLSAFNEHNPDSAVSFRRNGDVVEKARYDSAVAEAGALKEQVKTVEKDSAVELALVKSGAKNTKAV
ncbi:MAG: hypothetical protein IJ367_00345, partial [Clostridia bacterium]|nr:hypothetical protein [Clostridia bacterium]